ncbi:MAG: exodeoxyribonuclease V subunit gamma [Nocardioides sp.]|nr:exodeoxyribonuclease V subunit gamma [Nocardioides sp.]
MTLHLHRAPRTDLLADALGELLAEPLDDPFASELVLVPEAGVERWLSQRLSHRLGSADGLEDGVCAGVELRSPRSLVSTLTGTDHDDPWSPDALAWAVLEVLDTCLDEPWAATLAAHLGHGQEGEEGEFRRGRRYGVARRVAGLLASYARQRPGLLADWETGRATDGLGDELGADLAWQPPLWREVLARVGAPSPAQRHAATVAALEAGPVADLPPRLSLFGHTRMPVTEVDLLRALATHHDVHVWLPHPSDVAWQRLAPHAGAVPRHDDVSHRDLGHPLTATLGRDLRELERTLPRDGVVDTWHGDDHGASGTLLGWLQDDLRADEVRPSGRRLAPDDRAVQVHACHGPARQVEVLREAVLGLLADHPDLEPRDVLVMCPDVETYAPLVTAAFGLGEVVPDGHPAHRLRVQLADRSPAATNDLLGLATRLLALAGGRAPATEVLDLAHADPVRRRFGFTDDDLETLTSWTAESGVRWGLDVAHRAAYDVPFLNNTWRFGLDRVLAGVALSDDSLAADAMGWVCTALPLDDVGSNHVDLAGRFAELLDRFEQVSDGLTGSRTLAAWVAALVDGVRSLAAVPRTEEWQLGHLQRELGRALEQAGPRGETVLRLPDVRALLEGRLAGRPTRTSFRTGTLTVCTMVPMRSVPHRVVCLVGLDDGVFPRQGVVDGDDVLARTPLTGERDVRSEDRQLLLDAVGAATEHLVVTYTGADEHTNAERPPAVPLGELLDALDRTTEEPVRDRVVVRHPLQAFDPRNLVPGGLGAPAGEPFTFDPAAHHAARAVLQDRPVRPGLLDAPLPPPPPDDVALEDLVAFYRDPVKGFFRGLDVSLPWDADGVDDAMPVEIDALEEWGVGDRMLRDMLRGVHPDIARQAEWRRGALPPGRLGWRISGDVRGRAMNLAVAALTHRQVEPRAVDVDVRLPGGRRVTGTVGPVYGDRLVSVGYSNLAGKQVLESWIRLLALAAHDDDHHWTALSVGRRPRSTQAGQRLLAVGGDGPVEALADLVALYDVGRTAPLPFPMKTSWAWATARHSGDDAREQASRKWKSGRYPGEDSDAAHVRVWGPWAPLETLLEPGVLGPDHTLPALSERIWAPVLRSEVSL